MIPIQHFFFPSHLRSSEAFAPEPMPLGSNRPPLLIFCLATSLMSVWNFFINSQSCRMKLAKLSFILLIAWLVVGVIPLAAGDIDRLSSVQKALRPCINASELDCIEMLVVQHPNGKSSGLQLIQPAVGNFLDEYGQVVENSGSVWTYLDLNGTSRKLVITASLNGENYISPVYKKRYPAMWFTFLDIDPSEVNSGTKFRLTLKTSWLKPQGVGLMGANATFTEQTLPVGSRYTFIASPFLSTSLNSPEKYALLNTAGQEATVSDGERPVLYFVIDHLSSVPGGTFWDPSCAEFGYSVTSHNAIGAGQPFMSDKETLKFNIGAPHRLSTGEITTGFFTTDIPVAYLDCKWPGNTLTKSPRVEISIVNMDGTTQVATTTVKIEKKVLKVRAFGFHYSSPTIVLRASNNLSLPSLTSNVDLSNAPTKKATFTCIKGKVTKKVTAFSPKCPNGFKKK
jgi:hypothetical protein